MSMMNIVLSWWKWNPKVMSNGCAGTTNSTSVPLPIKKTARERVQELRSAPSYQTQLAIFERIIDTPLTRDFLNSYHIHRRALDNNDDSSSSDPDPDTDTGTIIWSQALYSRFVHSILSFVFAPTNLYATLNEAHAAQEPDYTRIEDGQAELYSETPAPGYQSLLNDLMVLRAEGFDSESTDPDVLETYFVALNNWYRRNGETLVRGAFTAMNMWANEMKPIGQRGRMIEEDIRYATVRRRALQEGWTPPNDKKYSKKEVDAEIAVEMDLTNRLLDLVNDYNAVWTHSSYLPVGIRKDLKIQDLLPDYEMVHHTQDEGLEEEDDD